MNTASWELFIEQYPQMMKLLRKLGQQPWFVEGGYATFIGHYHAGAYVQVYKTHWYNHTLDGVHFEIGVTPESLAEKQVRFDLHIGHRNLFDRARFNELTIDAMADVVAGWPGPVKFSKTNLSDRLNFHVKVTKTRFADQLTAGFAQLDQLSAIIDAGLAQLAD